MHTKGEKIFGAIAILAIIAIIIVLNIVKEDDNISTNTTNNVTSDNQINKDSNNEISDSNSYDKNSSDTTDIQEETTTKKEEYKDITISFTGDILLADNLYASYSQNGISGFLSPVVAEALSSTDLTFINQEFPFSNRGTPEPGKEYTYCVPPERVKVFNDMGVDIVSISNNHILDYGQDALADTFPTLDNAGIKYIGCGKNLDRAKELITFEVNGKTIGFLAASRVVPSEAWYARNASEGIAERAGVFTTYDDTALCEEIRKADAICDFVIVYAHWGVERDSIAENYQRNMAYNYIDAGADFVVGSHAHVMQGLEFYKDVPIVYGMGNFLFSNYYSRTTVVTLKIKEDNSCELSLLPCKSQTYYTSECDAAGIEEFYSFLNSVSFGVTFNSDGTFQYENHQ